MGIVGAVPLSTMKGVEVTDKVRTATKVNQDGSENIGDGSSTAAGRPVGAPDAAPEPPTAGGPDGAHVVLSFGYARKLTTGGTAITFGASINTNGG